MLKVCSNLTTPTSPSPAMLTDLEPLVPTINMLNLNIGHFAVQINRHQVRLKSLSHFPKRLPKLYANGISADKNSITGSKTDPAQTTHKRKKNDSCQNACTSFVFVGRLFDTPVDVGHV